MEFLNNAFKVLYFHRKMVYYAVARGHKAGIYDSWSKCEQQVKGFKGARYKKFPTRQEAESFIKSESNGGTGSSIQSMLQNIEAPSSGKTTKDFWPDDIQGSDFMSEKDLAAAMNEVEGQMLAGSENTRKRKMESTDSAPNFKFPKHTSAILEPTQIKKIGDYKFLVDAENHIIVYTDGSCINNGQTNAYAGFGVYFGDDHPLNAAEPVRGRVTNNVGEIQGAIHAIKTVLNLGITKLCINTDSQFLINSICHWIVGWKHNNWRLKSGGPVKNAADFKELDKLLQDNDFSVKWVYVTAHKGIKGNEMADQLAREGSDIYRQQQHK